MEDLLLPVNLKKLLRDFHLDSAQTGTSAGWHRKSAGHWLRACRSCRDASFLKTAELGGSADTPFEQAFSNLAHAYLKDKAPKLLEYEVGFQLIEKNQENTKAVGVFGFKVGDQWLYAPCFFLNGDLKGHELLYIKHQDIFVPLKDNWLNYLLGRKPSILGKSVDRNMSNLGVMPPNLQQMTRSPYKLASAAPMMARWFREFLPSLGYLTTTNFSKEAAPRALDEVMMEVGRPALEFMMKVAETYPTVFRDFDELHPGLLTKIARRVAREERDAASGSLMKQPARWSAGEEPPRKFQPPGKDNGGLGSYGRDAWDSLRKYTRGAKDHYDRYVKKGGSILGALKHAEAPEATEGRVEVVLRHDYWNGDAASYRLSDDEQQKVITEGRVVRDTRPESAVSRAYDQTTSMALQNPTETGLYDVLVRPFKFEKCLVVIAPHACTGARNFCTVVSLDREDRWLNTHPSRVWTRSAYSREAWGKWYDSLPDADSLPVSKDRYTGSGEFFIILGRNGTGTTPLKAYEEFEGDEGEGKVYRVSFRDFCSYEDSQPYFKLKSRGWDEFDNEDRVESVRLTGRAGTKLRLGRREMYVPGGFKKLTVSRPKEEDSFCCSDSSSKDPLEPGDLADVQYAINAGMVPLKVLHDGSEVAVNDRKMDKESAFRHLVVDWGFREAAADSLVKMAELTPRRWYHALVKLGGPYLTESQRGAPAIPEAGYGPDPLLGGDVPTRVTDERELKVNDMKADPGDQQLYKPRGPDSQTMQVAQQAAQTGQREVFDTAMLGSLLKAVRQDSMVDRYLGDLMKGMDRLGRIYFQFLWHGEEFEDRYGKQDLPELEDGVRNAFESMGDIVLVLKRKSVEPFAEQGTDVDLQAVAN